MFKSDDFIDREDEEATFQYIHSNLSFYGKGSTCSV